MTQNLKQLLVDAYKSSQMELACFGRLHQEPDFPTSEKDVTPFIRERTRLYRESWITQPLREALELLGFSEELRAADKEIARDPRTWSYKI